jgi:hypothetical protein
MPRTIKVLASLLVFAPLAVFIACSSSSSGGGGGDGSGGNCGGGGADGGVCTPGTTPAYTSCVTDLTTPTVSFATDVQPTFNSSCSLSTPGTCHALQPAGNSTPWLVYLGNPMGGVDAGQVLSGLVGQPAEEDPGMSLIKAGDPENSYLMHKLDYDQCQFSAPCNDTKNQVFFNCGVGMPYQSGILDPTTRDNIRRWIAQGAKNN